MKTTKPQIALKELSAEDQKKILADTFAGSLMKLIEVVVRKRCQQHVDVIYETLQKSR